MERMGEIFGSLPSVEGMCAGSDGVHQSGCHWVRYNQKDPLTEKFIRISYERRTSLVLTNPPQDVITHVTKQFPGALYVVDGLLHNWEGDSIEKFFKP